MTLKEYLANLNRLAQERPETLSMEVVVGNEGERNGVKVVHHGPIVGLCRYDTLFVEECWDMTSVNAVCVG